MKKRNRFTIRELLNWDNPELFEKDYLVRRYGKKFKSKAVEERNLIKEASKNRKRIIKKKYIIKDNRGLLDKSHYVHYVADNMTSNKKERYSHLTNKKVYRNENISILNRVDNIKLFNLRRVEVYYLKFKRESINPLRVTMDTFKETGKAYTLNGFNIFESDLGKRVNLDSRFINVLDIRNLDNCIGETVSIDRIRVSLLNKGKKFFYNKRLRHVGGKYLVGKQMISIGYRSKYNIEAKIDRQKKFTKLEKKRMIREAHDFMDLERHFDIN